MKKIFIIEQDGEQISTKNENFTPIELIGILRFYEKDIWLKLQQHLSKQEKNIVDIDLYYSNLNSDVDIRIEFLDKISIIESEFCVTNNDKIKYNEKISNERGFVQSIDQYNKTCLIKFENEMIQSCVVPITWLKFISRNNRKK